MKSNIYANYKLDGKNKLYPNFYGVISDLLLRN